MAILATASAYSQERTLLKTTGYGSVYGKVTLVGDLPKPEDFVPLMMKHKDKACCLDEKAKPNEKRNQAWIVDPKTKGVANVVIWVRPPAGTYFEIHPKLKVRNGKVEIDQPHCAYLPYVTVHQPYYLDGAKLIPTGQELIIKNSAVVPHNVRAVGDSVNNDGFNRNMASKSVMNVTKELTGEKQLKAQNTPIMLQCDYHTWMQAKLYVFDHPYYAVTKADGTFEIPFVPAGAELRVIAHHADAGWLFKNEGELRNGRKMTFEADKKTTLELQIEAPKKKE